MNVVPIAATTLRETLRERLMYNLVVFAVVLTLASLTISDLTLGEQYRIIADVGTSSTQLFGTLIAVFLGVALVSRELDRRTCYAVLARPVSRAEFVVGKYAGLLAALALNVLVMAVASGLVLAFYTRGFGFLGLGFVGAFALIFVQVALCAAFAMMFASFTTPTLATIFTLSVIAAGHLFGEVRPFWVTSPVAKLKVMVKVFDFAIPNLALVDLKEALTYGDAVGWGSLVGRLAYGAAWGGFALAIGAVIFSRKDVR
jgi:ABC-type transport system involved in multi-copper enzyme maturation permease subunit